MMSVTVPVVALEVALEPEANGDPAPPVREKPALAAARPAVLVEPPSCF
jgi:hypothetical protein